MSEAKNQNTQTQVKQIFRLSVLNLRHNFVVLTGNTHTLVQDQFTHFRKNTVGISLDYTKIK